MSWSPSTRAIAAAVLALALLVGDARAEDPAACSKFKWPLATENSWFKAGNLKELKSGANADNLGPGAFTIALKPLTDVSFALPSEGKPKPDKPLGAIQPVQ